MNSSKVARAPVRLEAVLRCPYSPYPLKVAYLRHRVRVVRIILLVGWEGFRTTVRLQLQLPVANMHPVSRVLGFQSRCQRVDQF
jgi:hypothetical protein